MEDVAKQVLNVTPCNFVPKHANNLANEFQFPLPLYECNYHTFTFATNSPTKGYICIAL